MLFRSGRVRGDRADGSSELPDGTKIRGFQELREYLLRDRQDQVAFSLAKHLAIYATGRSLTYNEMAWLRENIQQHRDSGYRICDIVRWIIHSDIFDKK